MKWLFIDGSPRVRGNTAYILRSAREELGLQDGDCAEFRLYGMDLRPCVDCRRCKAGELACPVQDGMQELYAAIEGADRIVIGSPIYWSGLTGPMKTFIDRLRPYYLSGKMKSKILLPALVAADGAGDCDLALEMIARVARALGCRMVEAVRAKGFDEGDVEREGFSPPDSWRDEA